MPSSLLNLSNLPMSLQSILTHCNGISLDLTKQLSGLPLQKKEEVLEYITLRFPYLKILLLGENRVESLPDSIGNLTQLTELNLSNNQLTTLPKSIGNLTQLTKLDLRYNYLTSLPFSMMNLSRTMEFFITSNQLSFFPEKVIKSVFQNGDHYYQIQDFLKTMFEKHMPNLTEIKQAKTLLAFSRISKEDYALIYGKSFMALKTPQEENITKPQEANQSLLPPEMRQKIFLHVIKVESEHQRAFMKEFRQLVRDKSNKNIIGFLDKVSLNWEKVVTDAYKKEKTVASPYR